MSVHQILRIQYIHLHYIFYRLDIPIGYKILYIQHTYIETHLYNTSLSDSKNNDYHSHILHMTQIHIRVLKDWYIRHCHLDRYSFGKSGTRNNVSFVQDNIADNPEESRNNDQENKYLRKHSHSNVCMGIM